MKQGDKYNSKLIYLFVSNGYVMNLGSNGMSGKELLYFTLQTNSERLK